MKKLMMMFAATVAFVATAHAAGWIAWSSSSDRSGDLPHMSQFFDLTQSYIYVADFRNIDTIHTALANGTFDPFNTPAGLILDYMLISSFAANTPYYTDHNNLTPGNDYELIFFEVWIALPAILLAQTAITGIEYEYGYYFEIEGMAPRVPAAATQGDAKLTALDIYDGDDDEPYKTRNGEYYKPIVPEPATGLLALAGIALLFRRKRR